MLDVVEERKLTELTPARRNRYYYGKLMDVLHFSMEQQYMVSKQWLYNRAVLGYGVVCGLGVELLTSPSGQGIVIHPGLAIDGWGREIVVPEDIQIVPLAITDQCGSPQPSQQLPSQVTVGICFSECSTDFAPAMVNDPGCGCGGNCEAGTVVESYCIKILAGTAPAVTLPCLDDVKKGLAAGDIHGVLCGLSKTCPPDPDDPCLILANVDVASGGALTINDIEPRVIAPTNLMLVQLLSCLADCCASTSTAPLQVMGVRVLSTAGDPRHSPDDPSLTPVAGGILSPPAFHMETHVRDRPDLIEVTLTAPPTLEPKSVTIFNKTGQPPQSVIITPAGKTTKGSQDQIIPMKGNVFRVYRPSGFVGRNNEVTLIGGPNAPAPAPNLCIQATDGSRLDGDWPSPTGPSWHSGDGTQGGDFRFVLNVI